MDGAKPTGRVDGDCYTWETPDLRTADQRVQEDITRLEQRLADVEQLAVETAKTLQLLVEVLEVRL